MTDESFHSSAVYTGGDLTENYGAVSVPVYDAPVFAFADAHVAVRRAEIYGERNRRFDSSSDFVEDVVDLPANLRNALDKI
jgi:hypothetical protein